MTFLETCGFIALIAIGAGLGYLPSYLLKLKYGRDDSWWLLPAVYGLTTAGFCLGAVIALNAARHHW